MMKVYFMY